MAQGLKPLNRLHLSLGILSYLCSPLWLAFLLLGMVQLRREMALTQQSFDADIGISSYLDIGGGFFQLLFGLGVVIILLFASLWLLKRLSAPRGEAAGMLRVVSGIAVGTRERVVVVEIAGNWLVLGVAPGRVTALAEMPRGSVPPAPAAAGSSAGSHDFAGRLRQMFDRRNAP